MSESKVKKKKMTKKTKQNNEIESLQEPLSIFTKYKTMVTPKINILNLF